VDTARSIDWLFPENIPLNRMKTNTMNKTKNGALKSLAVAGFIGACSMGVSQATVVVTNASFTANSLTFTVSGDLTGYTLSGGATLGIRYNGDMITVPAVTYESNLWTGTIDGVAISDGNTGNWNSTVVEPYTWSGVEVFSPTTVVGTTIITLTTSSDIFNTAATDTSMTLTAGNPGGTGAVSLAHFAVPEPSSTALLGLGGLALMLRRRK
jgi:hypothetical protein